MYPNLEAELKRRNLKRMDIAQFLGCSISTVNEKMAGNSDFSFPAARRIKQWLGVDIPLEELFASNDDD